MNYYVDYVNGKDDKRRKGKNIKKPWKTMEFAFERIKTEKL